VVPKTVNGSQAIDDQSRSNRNCGTWVWQAAPITAQNRRHLIFKMTGRRF
jgi:hypothetical protein